MIGLEKMPLPADYIINNCVAYVYTIEHIESDQFTDGVCYTTMNVPQIEVLSKITNIVCDKIHKEIKLNGQITDIRTSVRESGDIFISVTGDDDRIIVKVKKNKPKRLEDSQ